MPSEIHVNDIGTRFLATIKDNGTAVDISNASQIQMTFRRPSDEVFYRIGSLLNSGINGQVYYDTVAGDLVDVGMHKLQAKVYLPSGTYYTDIYSFQVHCNL
jgi:hypothetical protein